MEFAPFYLGIAKLTLNFAFAMCVVSSGLFFMEMSIRGEISGKVVGLQLGGVLLAAAAVAMTFVLCGLTFGVYVTGDTLEAARVLALIVMIVTALSLIGKVRTMEAFLTSSFLEVAQVGCMAYVVRLTVL